MAHTPRRIIVVSEKVVLSLAIKQYSYNSSFYRYCLYKKGPTKAGPPLDTLFVFFYLAFSFALKVALRSPVIGVIRSKSPPVFILTVIEVVYLFPFLGTEEKFVP